MSLRFSSPSLSLAAAGLAALTAAAHGLVGTFDTLAPVIRAGLALPVTGTLAACWHFITLFLVTSALVFWRRAPAAPLLGWLWIGFGAIFCVTAIAGGGLPALMALPQWVLLIPTGALAVLGTRKAPVSGTLPA